MRATQSAIRASESSGERRVSVRTETSIDVVVKRGRRVVCGRAVDLSQSGVLIEHGTVRRPAKDKLTELFLQLPDGPTRILVRPVRKQGSCFAYAFVDLTEQDQSLLTDYLFCQLAEESRGELPSGVVHKVPESRA